MTQTLFTEDDLTPTTTEPVGEQIAARLYAEVVFDLPLDQAYTYAVPPEAEETVAVGKRVEAPFGRGGKAMVGYCVRVTENTPLRPVKAITRVLDEQSLLTEPLLRLTRWMADYYLCGWGQVLQTALPAGVRENAGTRQTIFVEPVSDAELPDPLPALTPKQETVLQAARRFNGPMELRQLGREAKCGPGVVKSLVGKGYLRQWSERADRPTTDDTGDREPNADLTLNPEQQAAFAIIETHLHAGGFQAYLLRGVTGSGKTEVYLRAIEEVVKQGKEVIVLVPEIALTPQTLRRFRGRCGEIAVMHSHLTDSERGVHWRRIAAGQVQVVVGARSAIFAPTRNLGLIIIDEEHESSFKQESTPRYHARDVAVMRARLENIPIVLGSATPALESWHNAERGAYVRLDLSKRVEDRPMPRVELIDMRHERRSRGQFGAIGPTLEKALKDCVTAGGQAMLLLNRRGYSTHVHCDGCGHVITCKHCDLALTFHRGRSCMLCHYCGYEEPPPKTCPACAQPGIRYQGLGTEKLHAELEEKLPGRIIRRMDSDTTQRPGAHEQILGAFREGLIHVLLGTQMIAKGLDFPNVTLVGVINADVGLHLPDFRAGERTFQLLAQVAGRTGRGAKGGRVYVQTMTPEHPCIRMAAQHDYLGFAAAEIAHRKEHRYPPFDRLARVIIRSPKEESAANFAELLAGAFREATSKPDRQTPGVRVLGPAEAPVYRLNDFYRQHFQLQSASAGLLHVVLREVMGMVRVPHGVECQIDVDPYSML